MIKHFEILACEIDLNALNDTLIRIESRIIHLESLASTHSATLIVNDELLTRQEVADFFKVNISTVRNWTNQGILNKYGVGDRVYYKKKDVEAILTRL